MELLRFGMLPQGADQFPIPAGFEQVHTVQMTQGLRHGTPLQPEGDDEDLIIRKRPRLFEGELQFLVAVSALFVESPRKTDDHRVTFEDRLADLILPVLPGLEVVRIQPCIHVIFS